MDILDNQIVKRAHKRYIAPPIGFGSKKIEVTYIDTSRANRLLKEAEKALCEAYGHYNCFCGEKKR